MNSIYGEDQIKVLSDIDHIRLRKHLYIGDASHPFHLFLEVMDNSVDEVQSGCGTHIDIYVNTSENSYRIIDDGRGIPHGTKIINNEPVEILRLLCTKLNSGAKFDNESYKISSGLHGQGLCCVNALSSYFKITSTRDHKKLTYSAVNDDLNSEYIDEDITGTEVIFIPSEKYFENNIIPLDLIIGRCKTANAFGIKTNLYVDSNLIDTSSSMDNLYPIENDITTYIQYPLIYSSRDQKDERVAVYLRYTSDTKDKYFGYTNLLFNSVGGTHVNYISKLICEVWKEYIDSCKLKLEVELKPSDFLVGLRCIVAVFISEPEFSSQTKEKLTIPKDYLERFSSALKKQILVSLKFNDKQSKALVKRFEEYRISQNKLLSRKQISSLIKVNDDSPDNIRRRSIVDKLTECISKNRKDTELYIVEGTSACFTGNTKIKLLDGTVESLENLYQQNKKDFWLYSYDVNLKQFIPKYATDLRITRKTRDLVNIVLSTGEIITCTPDHKFLDKNTNIWVEAKDLTANQVLQNIELRTNSDYEEVYMGEKEGWKPLPYIISEKVFGSKMMELVVYPNSENNLFDYLTPSNIFVVEIEHLNSYEEIPVYCLTVEDTECFMLANGVVAHNCGPAKRTRNKNLQAILELRGKILNVTGMTPKQAIKSQEVCNIVNSIGAGIGEQCNSKRSRYDRIYINCDGDEDGLHINCLVLSVFVNLLPDIIKDGRLYTVVPPLYGWEDDKGKKHYGNHIEDIPKGVKFTRFKGLGEMDDDEYYETCLNPKTRKVVQLEYPTDLDEFNRILGTAGGKADLLKNLGIVRDDRDWSKINK